MLIEGKSFLLPTIELHSNQPLGWFFVSEQRTASRVTVPDI